MQLLKYFINKHVLWQYMHFIINTLNKISSSGTNNYYNFKLPQLQRF